MAARPPPDRLHDLIYAALLGESSWQLFLDELSRLLPNGRSVLFFHDADLRTGAFSLASGLDREGMSSYNSYYSSINPWMRGATRRPVGKAVRAETMLPREQLVRSEYYNDYLSPREIDTGVGVTLLREESCNFLLSINGKAFEDPFTDPVRVLDSCVPHLQRAFGYYRRREEAGAAFPLGTPLAEDVSTGIVRLGYRGKIKESNSPAARLLDTSDLIWTDAAGRLQCCECLVTEYVHWLLQDWRRTDMAPSCRLFLVRSRQTQLPAKMMVLRPFGSAEDWFFRGPECTLLIEPDVRPVLTAPGGFESELGRLFGLTPAEVRLCMALAGGASLQAAADTLGITAGTARVHLKSIFSKTDTHRQAELVALVARLGAPL